MACVSDNVHNFNLCLPNSFPKLDKETAAEMVTWLPRKLAPQIKCVFSMIDDTPPHKNICNRESKPREVIVPTLDLVIRKVGQTIISYLYNMLIRTKKLFKR